MLLHTKIPLVTIEFTRKHFVIDPIQDSQTESAAAYRAQAILPGPLNNKARETKSPRQVVTLALVSKIRDGKCTLLPEV